MKLNKKTLFLLGGTATLLFLGAILFFTFVNVKFIGKKSIHEDALKYQTRDVLVFYPNSIKCKENVSKLIENAPKDSIFDYSLTSFGDYWLVSYGIGEKFYITKDGYQDLEVKEINDEGKQIISDYLRYQMKAKEIDEAYSLDFLEKTYYENLNTDNYQFDILEDKLIVSVPEYNETLSIPLKYIQKGIGINLGYDNEAYIKPRYVSKDRKMICFTFDDGPNIKGGTSKQIVDTFHKYDSNGTFFLIGYSIGVTPNTDTYCLDFLKESIGLGNEYGSHTQNHYSLPNCSDETIKKEILTPYNDLKENLGYTMRIYRPPYGSRNQRVDNCAPFIAILWNVDSLDWSYRLKYDHDECVKIIKNKVISETDEYDIVLFHDIYQTSVDAAGELIPYFISQGYQLVTVSEMLDALNISHEANYLYGR